MRLKERYGDRETVARNARYTVRSLVALGSIERCRKRVVMRNQTRLAYQIWIWLS